MKFYILFFLVLFSCKKKTTTVNPVENCTLPTEIAISPLRGENVSFSLETTDSLSISKVLWTIIAPDKSLQIETTGKISTVQKFTTSGEYHVTAIAETTCGQKITLTRKESVTIKQLELVWEKALFSYNDTLAIVIPTSDKGCIVIGSSNGDGTSLYDTAILKINKHGVTVWSSSIFRSCRFLKHKEVIETSDGGYLIGGEIGFTNTGSDYYIVKINNQGDLEWEKTFTGQGYDVLTNVINTFDGGFLIGGYSSSGLGHDKSEAPRSVNTHLNYMLTDFWIIKITSKGIMEWDKTIGGEEAETLTGMEELSDKGFLLTGNSYSNKSGDKTDNSKGSWMVRLNSSGIKEYDKVFSTNILYSTPYVSKYNMILAHNSLEISGFSATGNSTWKYSPPTSLRGIIFNSNNPIVAVNNYMGGVRQEIIYLSSDGKVLKKNTISGINGFLDWTYSPENGFYMITIGDSGEYKVAFIR
jgi:hypothetical protein